MYIESVPNRNSPPAILLRCSYRDNGKVKKRTLLNLSEWPPEMIQGFKALLKGGTVIPADQPVFTIKRSLPHGHIAAILGTLRKIGLDRLLGPASHRDRDLVIAMITARLAVPTSKLATAKALSPLSATSSLGEILGLDDVDEDELYAALDWLVGRQANIEKALAKPHLDGGCLVLYDVSSSYVEGRCCELAQRGYNRDRKKGKQQIVYGLLCAADGCPVATLVFEGNTGDPSTVNAQIIKLKQRFGLDHVVLVGAGRTHQPASRGMITQTRINEDLGPAGLDHCLARACHPKAGRGRRVATLSLFDERDLASITTSDYPGERLIVCRNPALASERARKREDLLDATEKDLAKIEKAVKRSQRTLRGQAKIALKVGAVQGRHKMAKHFALTITDDHFAFARDIVAIAKEAALDGIYVIRTSVAKETLSDEGAVRAYKSLAQVERAFRALKTVDLQIRPLYHRLAPRARACIPLHARLSCGVAHAPKARAYAL